MKIFIEYGMLSDEKFYERAQKFVLLKDTEDKYYTLDEYKKLIEGNQTDKDGQLVYLYATDKEAQYSYIDTAGCIKRLRCAIDERTVGPSFHRYVGAEIGEKPFRARG